MQFQSCDPLLTQVEVAQPSAGPKKGGSMTIDDDVPVSFFFYLVGGLCATVAFSAAIIFFVVLR